MTAPVYDPIYGEAVYSDVLIDPDVYGEGPLVEAGGSVDGALAAAGSGTLTQQASVTISGALDLAASGSIEQDLQQVGGTIDGELLVAGSGAGVLGGVLLVGGALDMAGAGSLAQPGELAIGGALAVDGTATIVQGAALSINGALTVSGTGALALSASALFAGALAVTGRGTLGQFARADWSDGWPVTGTGRIDWGGELVLPASAVSYHEQQKQLPRVIVIKVNGVDVTDDVRYADAVFTSQVNGTPGDCSFAVRDLAHTRAFTSGQVITVHIDGKLMWRGFVRRVKRQYSADVADTTDPSTVARWFLIEGADVNLLLSQRIVYYKPDPAKAELKPPASLRDAAKPGMWREDAPVADVVKYVITHYTDLIDDGVTLDGVVIDGTMNPDDAVTLTGAQTVADFLRMANRLLGGIFYLTYDLRLVFRDVETATTNFHLTDAPADANDIGPRDYTFTSDASKMANDALVWGTAPGVTTVRFGRAQDTASQADHGRWQTGEYSTSMYKQDSIDTRANAMVYGNTQSKHGANVDRLSCEATIFAPLLFLGDVVWCVSRAFELPTNHSAPFDTSTELWAKLPLRRMAISFPTPTSTRFSLLLTQDIDEPWSIYEFVFPKIKTPGGGGIDVPRPPLPEVVSGGCTGAICGTTDTFSRSVSSGWGMSEAGLPWLDIPQSGEFGNDFSAEPPSGDFSVVDGRAQMAYTVDGSSGDPVQMLRVDDGVPLPIDAYFESQGTGPNNDDYPNLQMYFGPTFHWNIDSWLVFSSYYSNQGVHWFYYSKRDQGGYNWSYTPNVSAAQLSGDVTAVWCWRIQIDETGARARKWVKGTTEPDWQLSLTWTVVPPQTHFRNFAWEYQEYAPLGQPQPIQTIDNIDITGVNRCSAVQFDDFNRTVASGGWGTSDLGLPWQTSGYYETAGMSVNGSSAVVAAGASNIEHAQAYVHAAPGQAPWNKTASYTWRSRFQLPEGGSLWQFVLVPTPFAYSPTLYVRRESGTSCTVTAWANDNLDSLDIPVSLATGFTNLLWEVTPGGSHRAKLWADGASEPVDWLFTQDDSQGPSLLTASSELIVDAYISSGSARSILIDYIEFDYAGKPCYNGCSADAGAISTVDAMWNQSTSAMILGYPWGGAWAALAYDYVSGGYPVDTEVGVSGGRGYLRLNANTVIGSQAHTRLLGTGWNDGASSFAMTMKFRFTDNVLGGNWTVGVHGSDGSYDRWVLYDDSLWDYWSSGASPGTVITDYPFGNMQAGTWYMMKWDYYSVPGPTYPYGGYTRIKVWPASQSEPASWLVDSEGQGGASTPLGVGNYFYITLNSPGNAVQETLEFEYINFECANPPPSGEVVEVPTSGPYCETLTHSGGTHFATAKAWWPGSLVVYINGTRTLAFTANASLGEFTLSSAISASDTLRVCYQVNGASA